MELLWNLQSNLNTFTDIYLPSFTAVNHKNLFTTYRVLKNSV